MPDKLFWYLVDESGIIHFKVFYDEEISKFNLENLNTNKHYTFVLKPQDSPIYIEISSRIVETVQILWEDSII